MVVLDSCTFCKHQRKKMIDGWIPTCDAYPNGQPTYPDKIENIGCKICNPETGIGFEPRREEDRKWGRLDED